jgi:invasion protein IalB
MEAMMHSRGLLRHCTFLPAIAAALLLPLTPHFMIGAVHAQQSATPDSAGEKPKAEFALRGQRDARKIKYGDWQKFCFKTPGTNTVCRTSVSGTWETGQSAVRIDLIEREGESAARLQLFLPVGLYLQAGVKLTVDEGKPVQIPYVWCLTNTCIAADRADPALIRQMETGRQLKLEVADTNLLSVSTTLPLNQFASVRKAAPSRTFTQDIDE